MTSQLAASINAKPYFIGVTGASDNSKATVCQEILRNLHDKRCTIVRLEWFRWDPFLVNDAGSNQFDHPNSYDFGTLREILSKMRQGQPARVPQYGSALFKSVTKSSVELSSADVIIVVGVFTLYDENIRNMLDVKICVVDDPNTCLSNHVKCDIAPRSCIKQSVLNRQEKQVKPSVEEYMLRARKYADIISPGRGESHRAINMLVKHIQQQISERETRELSAKLAMKKQIRTYPLKTDVLEKAPIHAPQKALQRNLDEITNLVIVSEHVHNRAWETMFRSADENRENMLLCYNLLVRTLIEQALEMLPFERKILRAMNGAYFFKASCSGSLVALTLFSHGKKMEDTLKDVCDTVSIGKTQIDSQGTDTTVSDVPADMRKRYVMLLVPRLNNAKLCGKAIEKLVEGCFGCQEDKIMVLSLLATPEAIGTLCGQYPKIRFMSSLIDMGQHSGENVKSSVVTFLKSFPLP